MAADSPVGTGKAKREFAQLIRIQERMLNQLGRMREELDAPTTGRLVKTIRSRAGSHTLEDLNEFIEALEETIRALKLSQSAMRQEFLEEPGEVELEGVPNLPPTLARFLAERTEFPDFSYELRQDPVRGWIIEWKEHTEDGTVRGFGQFYERPYAWLDE